MARLDLAIEEAVKLTPPKMRAVIEALQALRGIAQVSAVTIVAELGEVSRFARARQLEAAQVAVEGHTERRILDEPLAVGLRTQPAYLVRGSSRRITIMRFRPANIRVINRRDRHLGRHLRCPLGGIRVMTKKNNCW